MKKTIFAALAAGALVLAGCTKTEVTEVPEGRAIGFDNFVTNAVKALDNNSINKFYVYGGYASNYNLFTDVEVSKATDEWLYDNTQYWENETTAYDFAAYSNDNEKLASGVSLGADNHLVIAYSTDGSKDLVYAYNHDVTQQTNGGTVDFSFNHILARVAFKFTKDATLDGTEIAVSEIKIKSIKTNGIFTGVDKDPSAQYAYGTWSGWTNSGEQVFDNPASLTDDAASQQTAYEFLIPQTATEGLFEVTFTLIPKGVLADDYGKTEENFRVELPATSDTKWNPAYTYVYTANISAQNFELTPIIFDVTEVNEGWTDDTVNGSDILLDTNTGTGN